MPLPREMQIPGATQRNKPTLQNAKMLLYRNLQPTAQPARVVTLVPTTLKCKECDAVWLRHPMIPDTFGMAGDRYYTGKLNYYVSVFHEHNGRCPGCGRAMPDPAGFKALLSVEVVDAQMDEEEREALRMRTGGRNAQTHRRRKKG